MDQHNATPDTQERSSVGRRTVLKGAAGVAWTVPAVVALGSTAAAATSTAFAFSTLTPPVIDSTNQSLGLTAKGTGPDGATITVTLDTWSEITTVVAGEWSKVIPAANVPEGTSVQVSASSGAWTDTKTYTKNLTPTFTSLAPRLINIANNTPPASITVSGTGKNGANIALKVGAAAWGTAPVADGIWTAVILATSLPQGVEVAVEASFGAWSDSKTYTKDTTAPSVAYTSKTTSPEGKSGSATGSYGVLTTPTADAVPTYANFDGGADVGVTGFSTTPAGTWTISWSYKGTGNVKNRSMSVHILQSDGASNQTDFPASWVA